jgi:hypothetical protein
MRLATLTLNLKSRVELRIDRGICFVVIQMRSFWQPRFGAESSLATPAAFVSPIPARVFGPYVSHHPFRDSGFNRYNRIRGAWPRFRVAGFPGRGIRRTVSKPTGTVIVAEDPDAEVGPFYRFYYPRFSLSDSTPADTWQNLSAVHIVDEQSAEEYFRTAKPMTAQFLDRAVLKGLPLQAALIATIRQYPREVDAEAAMGREVNKNAPKLPNARKRVLIGKRVNDLVEQAIHQLVPILENRVEDSGITGEDPFDIVADPDVRALGSKLAEDIFTVFPFTVFPWFDVFGSGSFSFHGLNKQQPIYHIQDHPAWKTFLLESTLLSGTSFNSILGQSRIHQLSGGFYHIVIDRYQGLQRTSVAVG